MKCENCDKEAIAYATNNFTGDTTYYCEEHFKALQRALLHAQEDFEKRQEAK